MQSCDLNPCADCRGDDRRFRDRNGRFAKWPPVALEPGPAQDPICGACVEGLDWGHVNPSCKSSNKIGGEEH